MTQRTIALLVLVLSALGSPAFAQSPASGFREARAADSADGKAVLAPIQALFKSFETGDAAAMLRQVYPDGRVVASGRRPDGTANLRQQTWTQFAERVSPERAFTERIVNPVIAVDDDVAMVWAFFTVSVGGKVNSCGIDHFDLTRENGTWKILNLTFSTRTTGCPAQ